MIGSREEMRSELTLPIYWTFSFIDPLEPIPKRVFEDLQRRDDLPRLRRALEWARNHPEEDLTDLLPAMPYTNAQLHSYLRELLHGIRNG